MAMQSNAASRRRFVNWISFKRSPLSFAASVVFLAALPLTSSAQPSFAEFNVTTAGGNPEGITLGPDNAIWFAELSADRIGRIDVNGAVTEYPVTTGSHPQQLVFGPDGNVYFTVENGNYIGQLIPSTSVVAELKIPNPSSLTQLSPTGITLGPDGKTIWFTLAAPQANAIESVTTSGTFSTAIALPAPSDPSLGSVPTWITVGPDNNLWFTEQTNNKIGTYKNGSIMEYPIHTTDSQPFGIVSDGTNLWFTERNGDKIGKITTGGTITEYGGLTAGAQPLGITLGVDGALWFTESAAGNIGKIPTSGASVTEYPIPTASSGPYAITVGADGALWFSETIANKIGRISDITFESFANVPGALTNVAIGADGTVYGLNSGGYIYTYNGTQFANIPGQLSTLPGSFSVGNKNAVWGLNSASNIYQLNASTNTFNQVPGKLKTIYVGADGDVWGLNVNNSIYHYASSTNSFAEVGGTGATLSLLAVGSAGAVYGVNYAGSIYWYNPGKDEFEYLTGTIGFDTSPGSLGVGIDGDVWALKGGVAYHWDVLHNTFDATAGLTGATQIAVGSGASVFALAGTAPYYSIWQWDATSQTWIQLGGNLASIAAGANGTVWGVNAFQQIYKLQGAPARAYQTLNVIPGATLDQISVGADGTVWGVVNFTVQYFNRGTQTFQTVPTPSGAYIAQVSVGAGNDVWGVTGCHNINPTTGVCPNPAEVGLIYEYIAGPTPTWKQIPGELDVVQVGANGDVWGINAAGETYYYDFLSMPPSWVNIPGTLGILSVGADGTVWGINANFQIYKYVGSTNGTVGTWDNIPGSLTGISVGSANNVWGININDQIYTWSNHFSPAIPGQLDEVWATFDGAVWGSNSANSAYQWNGSSFVFKGNGITDVLLGNAVNVWGVDSFTGAVYQWF
jgi:virginiamycin B lyase